MDLLTTAQAARRLGVHKATLQRGAYDDVILDHKGKRGFRYYNAEKVSVLAKLLKFRRDTLKMYKQAMAECKEIGDNFPAWQKKQYELSPKLSTGKKNAK